MKTTNKVVIVFAGIILGLVVSPAIASYEADAVRGSVAFVGKGSAPGIVKTVMIVGIENPQFVPQIVYLKTNDSVRFINQDGRGGGTLHDIVSVDAQSGIPNNFFNATLPNVGDAFTVKFPESGIYYYTDSIYPQVRGVLVVE